MREHLRHTLRVAVGVWLLAGIACHSGGSGGSTVTPTSSASTGGTTNGDPLAGVWQTKPYTAKQIDALLRSKFTDVQVDDFERTCPIVCGKDTQAGVLDFDSGRLVMGSTKNGGPVHEGGWIGTYAVTGPHTLMIGDTGKLYISVHFSVDGDELRATLIKDRFPDHSPWHLPQDGPHPLIIGKPLADTMMMTVIWNIATYTRA